jgi:hypothetical protein
MDLEMKQTVQRALSHATKRTMLLLLVSTMIFTVTGCGKKSESASRTRTVATTTQAQTQATVATTAAATTTAATKAAATTAAAGGAEVSEGDLTDHYVKILRGEPTLQEGRWLLAVYFEVTNNKEDADYRGPELQLDYKAVQDGAELEKGDIQSNVIKEFDNMGADIEPGETVAACNLFELQSSGDVKVTIASTSLEAYMMDEPPTVSMTFPVNVDFNALPDAEDSDATESGNESDGEITMESAAAIEFDGNFAGTWVATEMTEPSIGTVTSDDDTYGEFISEYSFELKADGTGIIMDENINWKEIDAKSIEVSDDSGDDPLIMTIIDGKLFWDAGDSSFKLEKVG